MTSLPSAQTNKPGTSKVYQEKLEKQPQTPRHNEYYMDDELSVFLVGGSLFRVHRYHLARESDVFKTMFGCPIPDEGKEGMDDIRPIHLPGVTRREFQTLLDYFYKGPESTLKKPEPPANPPTTSPARPVKAPQGPAYDFKRLLLLLKIATFYDMLRVRQYAIDTIQSNLSLTSFAKLELANTYDVPQWAESAYRAICSRPMPLTLEEARRVGIETAVLVAEARERLLRNQLLGYRATSRDQDVAATVRDVFFPGR